MSSYYAQFDKEDLDDWQGKPPVEEEDDDYDYKKKENEHTDEFEPCMADYGMHWGMFL